MFVKTKESFGGLDIVCNNAAIVSGEAEVRWRKMFEVNLVSISYFLFLFGKYILDGHIIN